MKVYVGCCDGFKSRPGTMAVKLKQLLGDFHGIVSEIPLFHILHARITFGNILGLDHEVEGVKLVKEDNGKIACIVTDSCFQTSPDYVRLGEFSNW